MIEYVVKVLTKKFNVGIDTAIYFYYELRNTNRLGDFIRHVEDFKDFEEIKEYYLGGTDNEL